MSGNNEDGGAAILGVSMSNRSPLMQILMADDIQPGDSPSYELCKTILAFHPIGAKMVDAPIKKAQSQKRAIKIPGAPEKDLIKAFDKEWEQTGTIGADKIIANVMRTARAYGVGSVVAGAHDFPTDEPLPIDRLHELSLYYNVLDPLNTAGSLVLNQDPNAPDFQKPQHIRVGKSDYHPSRAVVMLNEQPIYIEWSNSAFGFVGRSVYQRALYPLKSFVQSMITDNAILEKAMLLVMKMKPPGSVIDQQARTWFGFKRQALKGAKTGNVISIGIDEDIESLDLKNVREAAEFARNNVLKNIATSDNMPASLINQETLAEGFGEGTEDAKVIAEYIAEFRKGMAPVYRFFDNIVMRRAWSPDFYASIQRKYPSYASVPYETAFYEWKNAFEAEWPNLLVEPDSEKAKVDDIVMKAAIAIVEVLSPMLDPESKADLAIWLADIMNERELMFSAPLELDRDAIANYVPPIPMGESEHEPEPLVESGRT